MATWVYRCVSCGGTHEVSVRPAGAMLLRCTTLHAWAWHDESAFASALAPISRDGAGVKRRASKARGTKARAAKAGGRAKTGGRGKAGGRARAAARSRASSKKRTAAPRKRASRKTVRTARSAGRKKGRR